jgi:hypothetical protein
MKGADSAMNMSKEFIRFFCKEAGIKKSFGNLVWEKAQNI